MKWFACEHAIAGGKLSSILLYFMDGLDLFVQLMRADAVSPGREHSLLMGFTTMEEAFTKAAKHYRIIYLSDVLDFINEHNLKAAVDPYLWKLIEADELIEFPRPNIPPRDPIFNL